MRLFHKLSELLSIGYPIIVCGDFNTITEPLDNIQGVGKISRDGVLLKNIGETHKLKDTYRVLNPLGKDFTHFDKNIRTRIDRIYVSGNIHTQSYHTEHIVDSDHLGIIVIIIEKGEKKIQWKLNVKHLNDATIKDNLIKEIEAFQTLEGFFFTDDFQMWETLNTRLKFFFKNQARQRNMEKNFKYSNLMTQFLHLKFKKNKSDEEVHLTSLTKDLEKYNNEPLIKTQFHAGIISEDTLNRDRIFKTLKTRQKTTRIESIKNNETF